MRSVRFRLLSTLAALAAAILTVSAADPFESDNTAVLSVATLAHGVTQTRDLDGSGDIDYIAVDPVPGFSYEVRVMTAGFFTANLSRRNGSDGVVQAGDTLPVGTTRLSTGQLTGGSSHSSSVMRWIESANAAERTRYLRIDSGGTVRTAANSRYTVDFRETTAVLPALQQLGHADHRARHADGDAAGRLQHRQRLQLGGALPRRRVRRVRPHAERLADRIPARRATPWRPTGRWWCRPPSTRRPRAGRFASPTPAATAVCRRRRWRSSQPPGSRSTPPACRVRTDRPDASRQTATVVGS